MEIKQSEAFDPTPLLAEERRRERSGARAFFDACVAGDAEALLAAADLLFETPDGWRLAMRKVGRLPHVSEEIRAAFLNVWIASNQLPLRVGHRPTLAKALEVLLPSAGHPSTQAIRLYRGTSAYERERRLYGFSWTTEIEIARTFAEARRPGNPGGAVLLETVAPPAAILLVREPENCYDEGEVVVNPLKLRLIRVVERLSDTQTI